MVTIFQHIKNLFKKKPVEKKDTIVSENKAEFSTPVITQPVTKVEEKVETPTTITVTVENKVEEKIAVPDTVTLPQSVDTENKSNTIVVESPKAEDTNKTDTDVTEIKMVNLDAPKKKSKSTKKSAPRMTTGSKKKSTKTEKE
jgi:hypothetical protein